jgi:uncharacterized membrane protein
MFSDQIFLLVLFLMVSALLIGFGIPLAAGWVPPNSLYGFRTKQTLGDPSAWYPANRVCGRWCIVAGLVTAGVAVGTHTADLTLPTSAFLTIAALMAGVVAMVIHGAIASRCAPFVGNSNVP